MSRVATLLSTAVATRRTFRQFVWLLAVFGALSLFAASCRGEPAADEGRGEPAADEEGGGNLIVAVSADTNILDGHIIHQGTEFRMRYPMYDRLLEEEIDGSLTPVAVEDYEISEDGLVYTLHIRPDMVFHDGTPIDAEAVKWNFDRQLQEDHPQGRGGWVPEGFIWASFTWEPFVESVTVKGPLTVEIRLNELFPPFLHTLSLPNANLNSPTAAREKGEAFLNEPVGSGPFRLVEATQGVQTVYERNDDYWQEGRPKLDRLTLRPIPESSGRWAALQAGEIHVATELPTDIVRAAQDDENFNVDLVPGRHFAAIWPNQGPDGFEPFRDKRVRQAMAMAIDKESLVRDLLDPVGYVAHGPIADGNAWQNPDLKEWPYDPEAARELLAEAGYPDGFSFTLRGAIAGAGMIEQRAVASFIQSNLADVGIEVEVALTELADAFPLMLAGKDDAYLYGIAIGMAQPWNQLEVTHHSEQLSNWSRWSNREADRLMNQALETDDVDEQRALYNRVQEIAAEEQANIYLYHENSAIVTRREVQGDIHWTGNYVLGFKDVWIGQ